MTMPTETSYGTWWDPADPDNKVAGQLTWEHLKSPELSLLDPPMRMWAGRDLAAGEAMGIGDQFVPMLHGMLADRGGVTLLSCQFGGMKLGRTSTHRLRVGRVLTGVWLDEPDEAFARRVDAEFPALAGLLGEYPVRPVKWPRGGSGQLRVKVDDRRLSWRAGDVEASWLYKWSSSVGTTDANFRMIPTVELTSSSPRSLGYWFDEWLIPINQLLTAATGAKSNPAVVRVWMKKNLTKTERPTLAIPVWSRGVGEHDYEFDRHRVLMRAGAIDLNPGGLPDVLRRMVSLGLEQEVFLDLLTSTINYSDRPVRNRYLDLTSGLEAYHTQRHGIAALSPEAFKAQRKEAIDALSVAGVEATARKFIKRWMPTKPGRSLEERLRVLAKEVGLLDGWTVDPGRMAGLRNDVAHGNTGLDHAALDTAYEQAFDLARRLVLHELAIVEPT